MRINRQDDKTAKVEDRRSRIALGDGAIFNPQS